jgi:hypothetical protein
MKSTYWLIHYTDHYVGEYAELEEVPELHSEIEGFLDIFLPQVRDQGHTLEPMSEKCRQIVVKLLVN